METKVKELDAKKASGRFTVKNDRGLHTRPSTELVKCASSFKSHVRLVCDRQEVNAKSLLGILMLAATKGTRIFVEAIGDDAPEAVESILDLAKNQFYIQY